MSCDRRALCLLRGYSGVLDWCEFVSIRVKILLSALFAFLAVRVFCFFWRGFPPLLSSRPFVAKNHSPSTELLSTKVCASSANSLCVRATSPFGDSPQSIFHLLSTP